MLLLSFSFMPVSEKKICEILNKSAPETCKLDPISSSHLFECLDTIPPTLTANNNKSLTSGTFTQVHEAAIVKPLLRKPSLDHSDLKNFHCVSNLPGFKDHGESHPLSALQPSISYSTNFNLPTDLDTALRQPC